MSMRQFFHHKYVLNTCYLADIVWGSEDAVVNETEKDPVFLSFVC